MQTWSQVFFAARIQTAYFSGQQVTAAKNSPSVEEIVKGAEAVSEHLNRGLGGAVSGLGL